MAKIRIPRISKVMTINDLSHAYLMLFLIYISFETLFLNVIPKGMVGLVRYGVEIVGYGICLCIAFHNRKIDVAKYDRILFGIFAIFALSSIINRVTLKIFILGIRWLIRYIFIYFIISQTKWNKEDINKFIKYLKFIMIIEVGLSLFQIFNRNLADKFLLPRYGDVMDGIHLYSIQGESAYAIYGSFGRYGEFGYFISLAIWILIAEHISKGKKNWGAIITWSIILILSYCRQQVVGLVISFLFFLLFYKRKTLKKAHIVLIWIAIAIILPFSVLFLSRFEAGTGTVGEGIASRFLSVFSKKFIMSDYNGHGRTWFYTVALARLISKKPLLGFGVGMYGCQTAMQYNDKVYQLLNIPHQFSMDVYITSVIGQVGIIGFVALLAFYFYSIKQSIKKFNNVEDTEVTFIAILTFGYCVTGIILMLFGSSLSDRYMAFYMWCLMAFQRKSIQKIN